MFLSTRAGVATALFVFLAAAPAGADTVTFTTANPGVNPINDRSPEVVIAAPNTGASLQAALNSIFADAVSAHGTAPLTSEQQEVGLWSAARTVGPVSPSLAYKYASDVEVGVWSVDADNNLQHLTLFLDDALAGNGAPAASESAVSLTWGATGIKATGIGFDDECGTTVTCGKFTGINPGAFGFFVKTQDGIYYSADSLNGGAARSVAYQHGSSSNWAVAFDIDGDADFNDVVLYAESLVPVPEPGTMVLLGSGLLVAIRSRRARKQRA